MRGRGPGRVTGPGRIYFWALTLRAVRMFDTVRRFEQESRGDREVPGEVSALRPYEILVIVDPRPTDEEVAELLTQLGEQVKSLGAEVAKMENWGKRRLAYDMRKQREGTYAVFDVSAEPAMVKEFERQLRLNENVLRFLSTRVPIRKKARPAKTPEVARGGRLMASLNKVLLIGNLTRPPELRYTPSGTAVADLRLAVNRNYTTQSGEKREETCFLTVVVWGKQAEIVRRVSRQGQSGLRRGPAADARLGRQGRPEAHVAEVVAERRSVHGPHQGRRRCAGSGPEAARRRRSATTRCPSRAARTTSLLAMSRYERRRAIPPAQKARSSGAGSDAGRSASSASDKVEPRRLQGRPRLRSFVTERGKIIPRRISGSCARHQRQLTHADQARAHGRPAAVRGDRLGRRA